MNSTPTWTTPESGVAFGPTVTITSPDKAATVTLGTIWTDDAGVHVTIDSGDDPIPAELALRIADAIGSLARTAPPVLAVETIAA